MPRIINATIGTRAPVDYVVTLNDDVGFADAVVRLSNSYRTVSDVLSMGDTRDAGLIPDGRYIYANPNLVGARIPRSSMTVMPVDGNGVYRAPANTVLNGCYIPGTLQIDGDNVYLVDCWIQDYLDNKQEIWKNIIVEHSTFSGGEHTALGDPVDRVVDQSIKFGAYTTVRYSHLFGAIDNYWMGSNPDQPSICEYNYIHGCRQQTPEDHTDIMQTGASAGGFVARGNWIHWDFALSQTACINWIADLGPVLNGTFEKNLLSCSLPFDSPLRETIQAFLIREIPENGWFNRTSRFFDNYVEEYSFGIILNANPTSAWSEPINQHWWNRNGSNPGQGNIGLVTADFTLTNGPYRAWTP